MTLRRLPSGCVWEWVGGELVLGRMPATSYRALRGYRSLGFGRWLHAWRSRGGVGTFFGVRCGRVVLSGWLA